MVRLSKYSEKDGWNLQSDDAFIKTLLLLRIIETFVRWKQSKTF